MLFAEDWDYRFFRDCLVAACERHGCKVHAYVFMTNHTHLLMTPSTEIGVGKVMQSVGRRYVQHFNARNGRSGTLWEGRYRATVVETARYLFACYRYIELNPVRAGMVGSPADYPFSSYRFNALGNTDSLVTPHSEYEALGRSSRDRQGAYRSLFAVDLPECTLDEIRDATNKAWALGSEAFRKEIADSVKRRTQPFWVTRDRSNDADRV